MTLEGEILVTLDWDGRRVLRARVRSTRPLAAPRVLAGRSAGEAAAIVPLLYGVCANAQGAAAASALEAATARGPSDALLRARSLAVALEALQEDLRRLLIDLPEPAGVPGAIATAAASRRAIAPLLAELRGALACDAEVPVVVTERTAVLGAQLRRQVESDVLGVAADAFATFDAAKRFVDWSRSAGTAPARVVRHVLDGAPGLGTSDVGTMPVPSPDAIGTAVLPALDADPGFAHAPRWAGKAVETGALASCADHPGVRAFVAAHGNGVAARLLARLVEVARVVVGLSEGDVVPRVTAWSPRAGEGAAAVATARGLLLHRVRVEDGRVSDYAIVAPTEWNFHPQGALVRGLEALVADDERGLAHAANLVVQALDPCVACRVEVARA
jgi:Ni,Fe-hydrogenase I large subunit